MASGVIRGVLWGTAVSVIGAATLSVLSEPPQSRTPGQTQPVAQIAPAEPVQSGPAPEEAVTGPEAAEIDVPAGSAFNTAREDREAVLPQPDAAPGVAAAPELAPSAQDAATALPQADRAPAAQPEAGQAETAMPAPAGESAAPAVPSIAATQDPARIATQAEPQSPAAPEAEAGLSISTDPAQPDQAQAVIEPSPFTSPAQPDPEIGQSMARQAAEEEESAALTPSVPTPEPAATPRRQPLPVIGATPPAAAPAQTAPAQTDATPDTSALARPAIGTPATSLTERNAAAPAAADTGGAQDAQIPLRRHAVPFRNPEDKPLMAIVLIDRGDSPMGIEALASFPYPLTFAIDAARPDAPEAAARYRAAGFEVMALVDLTLDATAADVEVAMEAHLAAVPEAVAVMEGDSIGLQSSRAASDQVTAILRQRGYGLVMLPNGLNTAQKLAARAGVPSATVFRDFDSRGQDAAAIRRFLDQGAFKAAQPVTEEGEGVIMLGRLRPDTISALLLWGLQDRAQRVALAPVSALLAPEE